MARDKSKPKIKKPKITFSLNSSDAKEVILMGDFNNWSPKKHPMQRDENGIWKKAVMLPPGKYEYKFIVDGQWKEDPQNHLACPNDFGTCNNVLCLT